jgi:hypothetical protein
MMMRHAAMAGEMIFVARAWRTDLPVRRRAEQAKLEVGDQHGEFATSVVITATIALEWNFQTTPRPHRR